MVRTNILYLIRLRYWGQSIKCNKIVEMINSKTIFSSNDIDFNATYRMLRVSYINIDFGWNQLSNSMYSHFCMGWSYD